MPDWQLRKLMRFETEEIASQADAGVASDFNVLPEIPEIEGEDVVLLSMARESLLESHLDGLAAAGGKIDAFTPNAIGLYNAWLHYGVLMEDTVLVANIGHENVDVIVCRGSDLLFARNLSGGSKLFDDALVERFGVSAAKAEEIKSTMTSLEPGASFSDPTAEKASRALMGPAGQILSLLQSTVLFCKSQVKLTNLKLDRVMLCGGGAALPGLDSYLRSALNVSVEIFDPFQVVDVSGLDPESAEALEEHRMEAVVALGLAHAGSDPDAYSIEILPESIRRKRDFLEGTAFLIAAAVLAVAFLGLYGWKNHGNLESVSAAVSSLRSRVNRVLGVDQDTRGLVAENENLHVFAGRLHATVGSGEQFYRAMEVVDAALPRDFWIHHLTSTWGTEADWDVAKGEEVPILRIEGRAREGTDTPTVQFEEFVTRAAGGAAGPAHEGAAGLHRRGVLHRDDAAGAAGRGRARGRPGPRTRSRPWTLNEYWQENKRFVTMVAVGALVFLIAYLVLDGKYKSAIQSKNVQRSKLDGELKQSLYTTADLDAAEEENEALNAAVGALAAQADFEPRAMFRLRDGAASAGSQYLSALSEVREDLIPRANRNNLKLDPGLGMPALSPTREDQIERYLEALDIIDSIANLAIDVGVRRIDKIDIRLDPGLGTRQGVGRIERTRVKFSFEGAAHAPDPADDALPAHARRPGAADGRGGDGRLAQQARQRAPRPDHGRGAPARGRHGGGRLMKLRQEQIVFVVALLLLGLMTYDLLKPSASRRSSRGGGDPAELVSYPAPDLALALPAGGAAHTLERDLLSPPSDVRPLPPLGIIEPPRPPLASLFPPPEPGPAPAAYGRLLRRPLEVAPDPDVYAALFGEVDTGLGEVDYDDFEFFRPAGEEKPKPSIIEDVREYSQLAGEKDPFAGLTAQEAALVIERWKAQYDWFWDEVRFTFGRIKNKDRFGLKTDATRADEAFLFVELLPGEGGVEKFKGMDAISIDREAVVEWDFAGTFGNRIEVRRRELGDAISRSTYNEAMTLAADCVRGRLEATRALDIAAELYNLCSAFDAEDPAPRLGLARCYEAGFAFEQAFDEYNRILEQFDHRAEVHARLGALEARFFLFDQAEERLRHAVSVDRGSWEARWELGRFLASQGRHGEALEHLEAASTQIPNAPELLSDRATVRIDLASTQFALGQVGEAHTLFGRALTARSDNQRALAGWTATELLGGDDLNGSATPPEPEDGLSPGLELLLARGAGGHGRRRLRRRQGPARCRRRGGPAAGQPGLAGALLPGRGGRLPGRGPGLHRPGPGVRPHRSLGALPGGPPARPAGGLPGGARGLPGRPRPGPRLRRRPGGPGGDGLPHGRLRGRRALPGPGHAPGARARGRARPARAQLPAAGVHAGGARLLPGRPRPRAQRPGVPRRPGLVHLPRGATPSRPWCSCGSWTTPCGPCPRTAPCGSGPGTTSSASATMSSRSSGATTSSASRSATTGTTARRPGRCTPSPTAR